MDDFRQGGKTRGGTPKGNARPQRSGSIGLVRDLDWEANAFCGSRWATREACAEMDATDVKAQCGTIQTVELVLGTAASACDRADFSGAPAAPAAPPTSFGMAHRALDRSAMTASQKLKEEQVLARNLDVSETRGSGTEKRCLWARR
ncbi:hypothetical protein G6011_08819 [Alternaria panax]|uniref:Uncharacterized protein n=1 Tax=Alternaria panax TaxID=48097 RepID=A0AAD4FJJ9_9PLEO|nr:hypothetical protein G6011_08819 [Alternaria panax]